MRPDTWESIGKDLMALLQGNVALSQAFQDIRPQLDEMDNSAILELLPSETELALTRADAGNFGMFDVPSAILTGTESSAIERLLIQLRAEISLRNADSHLASVGAFLEGSERQAEDDDEAFALACALVDELELGWDKEWQQAAIADWEASGL